MCVYQPRGSSRWSHERRSRGRCLVQTCCAFQLERRLERYETEAVRERADGMIKYAAIAEHGNVGMGEHPSRVLKAEGLGTECPSFRFHRSRSGGTYASRRAHDSSAMYMFLHATYLIPEYWSTETYRVRQRLSCLPRSCNKERTVNPVDNSKLRE